MRAPLVLALLLPAGSSAVEAQQGRSVFEGKGNCWTCHGKNGKGTPLAPDLTDGEWLHADGTVASIRRIVVAGVPKPQKFTTPMPPMGGAKLNAKELDAVSAYVLELAAAAPRGVSAPPARPASAARRTRS